MKRSELKVGMTVAYQRSTEWDEPEKVTVLAIEPHVKHPRWFNSSSTVPHYIPTDKGNSVLVERTNRLGVYQDLMQLAQLRGPYDEVKAEWDVNKKADRERTHAQRIAKAEAMADAETLIERAKALGITARNQRDHSINIELTRDDFRTLLAIVEHAKLIDKAPCGCPISEVGVDGHRE